MPDRFGTRFIASWDTLAAGCTLSSRQKASHRICRVAAQPARQTNKSAVQPGSLTRHEPLPTSGMASADTLNELVASYATGLRQPCFVRKESHEESAGSVHA